MRPRALLLAALLASLALAGCSEETDRPRLAMPTNVTAGPTPPPILSNPPIKLDYNDPGYRMNATWRAGDGWDYESNKSRWRSIRVLEAHEGENGTRYLLEETSGWTGSPASSRQRSWVDGATWMRRNITDVQDFVTVLAPGQPLRYLKNGSYSYTEKTYDPQGRLVANNSVYANVAYVNNDVAIRLPWGNVATGKLEHRIVTVDPEKRQARTQVTQWIHRDYANPVQYQINLDETYTLTAAKVGDRAYRALRPT